MRFYNVQLLRDDLAAGGLLDHVVHQDVHIRGYVADGLFHTLEHSQFGQGSVKATRSITAGALLQADPAPCRGCRITTINFVDAAVQHLTRALRRILQAEREWEERGTLSAAATFALQQLQDLDSCAYTLGKARDAAMESGEFEWLGEAAASLTQRCARGSTNWADLLRSEEVLDAILEQVRDRLLPRPGAGQPRRGHITLDERPVLLGTSSAPVTGTELVKLVIAASAWAGTDPAQSGAPNTILKVPAFVRDYFLTDGVAYIDAQTVPYEEGITVDEATLAARIWQPDSDGPLANLAHAIATARAVA